MTKHKVNILCVSFLCSYPNILAGWILSIGGFGSKVLQLMHCQMWYVAKSPLRQFESTYSPYEHTFFLFSVSCVLVKIVWYLFILTCKYLHYIRKKDGL